MVIFCILVLAGETNMGLVYENIILKNAGDEAGAVMVDPRSQQLVGIHGDEIIYKVK